MNKLFVTLYIGDRFCQYRLDELIQSSVNGYISPELVMGGQPVYFPVQIENEQYSLQIGASGWTVKLGNDILRGKHELRHGDYYVIGKEDLTFAALVTDYSKLSFSACAYELKKENVFFGRSGDMNVVLDINGNIPRKHGAICPEGSGHRIEDLSGKLGIYLNGQRITSGTLTSGDEIHVMGTTMVYFPNMLIIPAGIKTNGLGALDAFDVRIPTGGESRATYVRTPRILKSPDTGKVVIDGPTSPQRSKEIPFLLTAGPSMTMSLAMLASLGVTISNAMSGGQVGSLITSGVMSVSMLAGALLWPNLLRSYNKRQAIANEQYRQDRYSAYLSEKEREISGKYERNTRVHNETLMPSPEALISFVVNRDRRLWERGPGDEDFLSIRLGLGQRSFEVDIQAPGKGFVLEDDAMVDKAIAMANKYRTLVDVPVAISLREKRTVGVVGDTRGIANAIITNIVTLHSYDEVKLVLLYNPQKDKSLKWATDLPHTWSSDRKQRYVATTKAEAQSMLAALEETITAREATLGKEDPRLPHYVVLVMDEGLVQDTPFRRHLVNGENRLGISTVFFGKRFSGIPKECTAIIQKDEDVCGMYIKNENNNQFIRFAADTVSDDMIDALFDGINTIKVKTEKGVSSVPDRVTFLDMYKVGNIDALSILNRWSTNTSHKSLAAPIGIKSGSEAFQLDLHEKHHGCHGLVAGTTGSGKSEFLQAYILSMMINYSPNEVAFVLVDFKGGDMARPFLKSPHLAATISNLSGNTLYRALISLEAEVKSRQSLFNRSAESLGIDKIDINSYHRYFKEKKLTTPLPHLIIVIDEFAQLKSQHPEFMAKLIDIAQVGRSLGIHLILATQRPSGVVDPQIWSNSRFKVCLKVLDKQDSVDMINRPEAALIKQPGRAYVQVGYDEIFEQIQSGYSGADYIPQKEYVDEQSVTVRLVNGPAEQIRSAKRSVGEKTDRTQLEQIMTALSDLGNAQGLKVKKLWLPPLPETLLLEACVGHPFVFNPSQWKAGDFDKVVCGTMDLPEVQKQESYAVDLIQKGHLAIYGSSGSGKSTLIQTIVFAHGWRYAPEDFQLFVLDFDGGSLASLGAMPHCVKYASGDDESQVEGVLDMLQSMVTERRELFASANCANFGSYIAGGRNRLPMVALVLDNYAAFREKMYRSEDRLVQLISAARSCGIYLLVTGSSKGAIYYKIIEQISDRVVLNMTDSGAYRDILNVPTPIEPAAVKGRGLTVMGKKAVEVQFAVPFDCENESARIGRIQELYGQMCQCSKRPVYAAGATRQPEPLPEPVQTAPVISMPQIPPLAPLNQEDEALVIGYDSATKAPLGFSLEEQRWVFIGTRGNRNAVKAVLNRLATNTTKRICLYSANAVEDLNPAVEIVDELDDFIQNVASNAMVSNMIFVIDGFCDFFDQISDEALSIFEGALQQGTRYNIVTFDDMVRMNDYRDTGLYVNLIRTPAGAVVGGAIDDDLAAGLTNQIYQVHRPMREKALPADQAAIYISGKCAYATIERRR